MLTYYQLVGVLCLQSEVPARSRRRTNASPASWRTRWRWPWPLSARPAVRSRKWPPSPKRPRGGLALSGRRQRVPEQPVPDQRRRWRHSLAPPSRVPGAGRSEFSNREIRLGHQGQPRGAADPRAKALEERCNYLRIEKTGRGRFRLQVDRPLNLVYVEGGSPL